MDEKIDEDFRQSLQFILKNSPYTQADILQMSLTDFLKTLHQCEAEAAERAAQQKQLISNE